MSRTEAFIAWSFVAIPPPKGSMLKFSVLLLAGVLANCAFPKRVPYQYQFGGKVYKSTMWKGRIVDTSFVYAADTSVERIFVWNRNGNRIIQTLLRPKDTAYALPDEGARTTEGVERVIYGAKKKWKSIYNRFLKERPGFVGKVVIRLIVRPDGNIENIFILEDTTGYPEFTQAVLDVCSAWRFEKSGGTASDWITFPVNFF